MRIKCIHNRGSALMAYPKVIGRSANTEYNAVEIGEEYLVMGILLGENQLDYLIDSHTYVSTYPYQLFEVTGPKMPAGWYFKPYIITDKRYPDVQAIWGYYELCFVEEHLNDLLWERTEEAGRLYFRRRIELEKQMEDDLLNG